VRYNLEDHLGNSSVSVDSSGSLITREEYFPFGETSFGSYARKRYRFCGKERDEESGFYYYGARYYACWCCRFVSVDPLAGSMPFASPYSYAANNPILLVDVDGLAPGDGSGDGGKKNKTDSGDDGGNRKKSGNRKNNASSFPSTSNIGISSVQLTVTDYVGGPPIDISDRDCILPEVQITAASITPSKESKWRLDESRSDGAGDFYTSRQDGANFEIYHQFTIEHQYHEQYGTETSGNYFYRKAGGEDNWHPFYPKGYGFHAELQQTVKEFKPLLDVCYTALSIEVCFLIPGGAVEGFAERLAIRESFAAESSIAWMDGSTVLGMDAATTSNAGRMVAEPGVHQVLLHGTTDGFIVDGAFLSPKELARTMLQSGFQKGTPTRLISCWTGVYSDGAAYQLSRYLASPVTAPTERIAILEGGEYYICGGGYFRTFFNTLITQ
jgi:RHS repeat-associated protein